MGEGHKVEAVSVSADRYAAFTDLGNMFGSKPEQGTFFLTLLQLILSGLEQQLLSIDSFSVLILCEATYKAQHMFS